MTRNILLAVLVGVGIVGCKTPTERVDNAEKVCIHGWVYLLHYCYKCQDIPVPAIDERGKPIPCHTETAK